MISLSEYIKESLEDGKYLDLPSIDLYKKFNETKPTMSICRSEAALKAALDEYNAKKKAHRDAWKAHNELLKKIDDENMEILIDKIMKCMNDPKRHEDFIKAESAKIIESIKNSTDSNKRSNAEKALIRDVNRIKRALLTEDTEVGMEWVNTMEEDIYKAVGLIALKYNIDIPKWSDLNKGMVARSAYDLKTEYEYEHRGQYNSRAAAEKKLDKFDELAKKDKEAVKKFRAKWVKTEEYKKLAKLADMFENDVDKIMKSIERSYTKFDVLNGKDKEWKEMKETMAPKVEKVLKKEFGKFSEEVTCYGSSLVDILITVALAGDKNPKIETIDKKISSWLAGSRTSCKFKVTDKDGNTYETGKYEDRGMDGVGYSAHD